MEKCKYCSLQDEKPCYECNECMGGDDHFEPIYKPEKEANKDEH